MPMTDAQIRNLTDPGKHFGGGGLYLELTKAGGKYWRLKYRFLGIEKNWLSVSILKLGLKPPVIWPTKPARY